MSNNKEYFVSKLSLREDENFIKDVYAYEYDGTSLSNGENKPRDWMVSRKDEGSKISILKKNVNGKWVRGKEVTYTNNLFSWENSVPKNDIKRKTFVSYYHKDDQEYRELFEKLFEDLIVSKSVEHDDIDSDNSDEYIKQLIQKDYLSDTTVLVVLIGPKTKCRKHIDWEISGALNLKVGDSYSGILGILLPSHPDYGKAECDEANLPKRLAANVKSGYAIIQDWTTDRSKMQNWIQEAYDRRSDNKKIVNASIPQMTENTCD
jgi:hypothetical protein